jgi:hypothetical protein
MLFLCRYRTGPSSLSGTPTNCGVRIFLSTYVAGSALGDPGASWSRGMLAAETVNPSDGAAIGTAAGTRAPADALTIGTKLDTDETVLVSSMKSHGPS